MPVTAPTLGVIVRAMGPQSSRSLVRRCAELAEAAGLDELWVSDHIAIPPDDAEGSGGRYLDPLSLLAYLAGATERIGLGTAVLNLPYRPALPTAKAIATVQELSGERLRLGIGVGWMHAEFKALGVDRRRRGALTNEVLERLHAWFAADEAIANDQPFLFLPRPARPPIFVGGESQAALERAARYGDGWMPMGGQRDKLEPAIAELRRLAAEAGRDAPEVVVLGGVPLDDPARARDQLAEWHALGVTRVALAGAYDDERGFARNVEAMAALRS